MLLCFLVAIILSHFVKTNIKPITINKKILLCLIVIIQIEFRIIGRFSRGIQVSKFIQPINIITLILVILFIYYNLDQTSFIIVGVGYFLNAIVMIVNNGKMPVLTVSNTVFDVRHCLYTSHTSLKFLSDIIALPYPLGVGMKLSSIGDMIVILGFSVLILQLNKKQIIN